MAHPVVLPHVPDLPAAPTIEFIAAVTREAQRDAERVVAFLQILGLQGSEQAPLDLPADFLLELGAALRLHELEYLGLNTNRAAGLPAARDALRVCFQRLNQPEAQAEPLGPRLLGLLARCFAWHSRPAGLGPVQLDDLDDILLDAIAEFCWQNRHRLS